MMKDKKARDEIEEVRKEIGKLVITIHELGKLCGVDITYFDAIPHSISTNLKRWEQERKLEQGYDTLVHLSRRVEAIAEHLNLKFESIEPVDAKVIAVVKG